jgi:hypothetical protein
MNMIDAILAHWERQTLNKETNNYLVNLTNTQKKAQNVLKVILILN